MKMMMRMRMRTTWNTRIAVIVSVLFVCTGTISYRDFVAWSTMSFVRNDVCTSRLLTDGLIQLGNIA
jgi:hypothetical protein